MKDKGRFEGRGPCREKDAASRRNPSFIIHHSSFPWGLVLLAVALTLWAGTKPDPQPQPERRLETVIIVTPLGDGMYNTQELKIEKDELDEARKAIGQ